jgi:hypothetical protein
VLDAALIECGENISVSIPAACIICLTIPATVTSLMDLVFLMPLMYARNRVWSSDRCCLWSLDLFTKTCSVRTGHIWIFVCKPSRECLTWDSLGVLANIVTPVNPLLRHTRSWYLYIGELQCPSEVPTWLLCITKL